MSSTSSPASLVRGKPVENPHEGEGDMRMLMNSRLLAATARHGTARHGKKSGQIVKGGRV